MAGLEINCSASQRLILSECVERRIPGKGSLQSLRKRGKSNVCSWKVPPILPEHLQGPVQYWRSQEIIHQGNAPEGPDDPIVRADTGQGITGGVKGLGKISQGGERQSAAMGQQSSYHNLKYRHRKEYFGGRHTTTPMPSSAPSLPPCLLPHPSSLLPSLR